MMRQLGLLLQLHHASHHATKQGHIVEVKSGGLVFLLPFKSYSQGCPAAVPVPVHPRPPQLGPLAHLPACMECA